MCMSSKKMLILVLLFTISFVTMLIIYRNFDDTKVPKSARLVYYLQNNDLSF
jgi:hypothetical protein